MMDRVVAGKLLKQAISESTEEEGRDCSWIMLRLVDLVVEYEREACARICDGYNDPLINTDAAAAIRSRT